MHKKLDINENEPVAIIGLSGIFPGSSTVTEFFRNVLRKRCFIRELPEWLWEKDIFFDEDRASALKTYSHLGALLGDMEIDLDQFHIPPTVAKQISLNQKLALVCAQKVFDDAGYIERDFNRERTGMIIAATVGELWQKHVETALTQSLRIRLERSCRNPEEKRLLGELWDTYESTYPNLPITEDSLPGHVGSLVAGRIASVFSLNGPQCVLDSACASSLTAVVTAVTALRSGICDMVITGGVETDMSEFAYLTLSKICALSGNGSYPFDERADGFVVGEGCGLMLLKRYKDAVRDNDRIYALIRGVGSSSDGAGKGILAPNSKGQLMAMEQAYEDAAISPSSLQYIECHGTGTRVGDATELDSVNQLIARSDKTGRRQRALAIGSVKAMIGHARMGSGAAGLLRGILAVNSRVIPPQVNFERPNPNFDWKTGHLRVITRPEPISNDEVCVGVSGFGFGGANCHVVISSPPVNARKALVNVNEFVLPKLPSLRNDIAFLFPGQGSQYVDMLKALRDDPVAKSYIAVADEIVSEISGHTLSNFIYPSSESQNNTDEHSGKAVNLRDTAIAQPAIFVISAILLEKVRQLGINSGMALGHSLGEYTALYAAGILNFEEALRAVAMRGYLMAEGGATDSGTMAFVEGNAEQVNKIVDNVQGYAVCANLNSYDQTVVSGETAAINQIVKMATDCGINAHVLNVDRAFHSRIVSSSIDRLRVFLQTLTYHTVSTPIPANVSRRVYPFVSYDASAGKLMNTTDRNRVIDLLCKQIDHPVDFVSQVELAYETGIRRFVEVGPRAVLTHLVDDMLQGKPFQAINLDDSREGILYRLNNLKEKLSQPLTISRRPLPTKPRYVRKDSHKADSFASLTSTEDHVRAVVARVSGYSFDQISDEAEFERDLGIDTLKIIQIIALLRGNILPEDFGGFRNASSVAKIVAMAEASGFAPKAASVCESETQSEHDVHCYRYEVIVKDSLSWTPPGEKFNIISDPTIGCLKESLAKFSKATPDDKVDTILIWSLPDNPDKLCNETIPGLLQHVAGIADMSIQAQGEPAVHIITLCSPDNFDQAAFYAITGMTKSMQKDLPYLRLSYCHIDSVSPDENLIRRAVANPTIGKRLFPDGRKEQGRLVYHPNIDGGIEELADLLGEDDVVLVTGGARGIAASIVRRLIPIVKSRFLLIGRKPHKESWIDEEGLGRVEYLAADLCNADAVRTLNLPERDITLIFHAAGIVISRPIKEIQREELDQVLGTKILGLYRILDGMDLSRVRGIVNFSSLAAYIGGDGHPDYAAANAYLNGFAGKSLPVLSIGWSAWAEEGMASREGTKQFLEMAGVEPIPLQRAVETFGSLLAAFLKSKEFGVQNFVVHAGLAETCFLSNDPFRPVLTAPLPPKQQQIENTFQRTHSKPGPPAASEQSPLAGLESFIVSPPDMPGLDDTDFVVLRLKDAAEYGRLNAEDLYTPLELDEISALQSEKRRYEKFAGKLAVKLIADNLIRKRFSKEYGINDFQVLSSSTPVHVSLLGENHDIDALDSTFFSISHNADIVCAAVADKPVGIDVETIRTLPPETVNEICDESLQKMMHDYKCSAKLAAGSADFDEDILPITVFTQKEAILKAAGVGIANGLAEVLLQDVGIGKPVDAVHNGKSYRVVSTIDGGYAYSFAWLNETRLNRPNSDLPGISLKPVTPSFGQEGIWFQEKLKGPDSTYCVAWTERFRGQIDMNALVQSLQHIVDRHEAIRTVFSDADGRLQAKVLGRVEVNFPVIDLTDLAADIALEEIDRKCKDDVSRGFRLESGPLFRMILFRIEADDHILFCNFHHIIIDATSAYVFRQEFAACYTAFRAGEQPDLPPLSFQYSDFALSQRKNLNAERLEELVGFWHETLLDCPPALNLPTDYKQNNIENSNADYATFELPADLLNDLRDLSRSEGVTLFVTFLAAFQTLLMRLSGQDDIVVGIPFVGRENVDSFSVIGYFINMLPLCTDMSANPEFRKLLSNVQKSFKNALEHQDLPFQKLVEKLPRRHSAHAPFFRTIICLLHEDYEHNEISGLDREFKEIPPGNTEYDLSLFLNVRETRIYGRFEYNSDLFAKETIERFSGCFVHLLRSVVQSPDSRLSEIPILSDFEKEQILETWNDTGRSIPAETIPAIFRRVAEHTPNSTALICNERQLTYRQLNERSNQLAHYLRKQGVGPDICVGVALDRSVEMVVSILGILKAGGVYVPLDTTDPSKRLSFIMADANIQILLTNENTMGSLPDSGIKTVLVDRACEIIGAQSKANPPEGTNNGSLAYIMYTSGSTGQPKGVAITHQAIVRLLFGIDYVELDDSQIILQMAPMTFDASTFELWGALLHGGTCVLFPYRIPTVAMLKSILHEHHVNTLWLTSSLFNTFIDEAPEILAGIRQLIIGGEALSVAHVRRAVKELPETAIVNGYGPTESTTFACCYQIPGKINERNRSIPIGRPIANTTAYILDRWGNPVPVGVCGELYIGGLGLARGYVNRPQLNAQKFIADPFSKVPQSRLYKTGDFARYRSDGNIEFLARVDNQVKIRGFRIEPGEIECVLKRHSSVKDAAVVAKGNTPERRHLSAYIVRRQGHSFLPAELRGHLKNYLPHYMVPQEWFPLDAFPLTPNGKIDRTRLISCRTESAEPLIKSVGPRTSIERRLVKIWAELLHYEDIGIQDDFFDLGGSSLLAVRLFAEIERAFGKTLPLSTLFKAPTLGQLAEAISLNISIPEQSSIVPLQTAGDRTPLFLIPPAASTSLLFINMIRKLNNDQPVYGIDPVGLYDERPHLSTVEEIASHNLQEIRRIQPEGPYLIGGICFGVRVAYEMAQQIRREGQEVGLLVVFDSSPPRLGPKVTFYLNRYISGLLSPLRKLHKVVPPSPEEVLSAKQMAHEMERNGYFRNLDEKTRIMLQAHNKARRRYFARKYEGRVALFQSEQIVRRKDIYSKWMKAVPEGIDYCITITKSSHYSLLFGEEHLRLLAEQLNGILSDFHANLKK